MAVSSIPSRNDFALVLNSPDVRHSTSDLLLLARKIQDYPESRIGFVTSKKKIRRAVDRNRFRRVFKESVRRNAPPVPADLIIIARRVPSALHDKAINRDIDLAMAKLYIKLKT